MPQFTHAPAGESGWARNAGGSGSARCGVGDGVGPAGDGPTGRPPGRVNSSGTGGAPEMGVMLVSLVRHRRYRWSGGLIYRRRAEPFVGGYREYPRPYRRPPPARVQEEPAARSNAAIPVAVILVGIGLYFGSDSLLIPALLGLMLFASGVSFLSTRLNPLSPHFYLTRKPSWLATGVVFLGALALLGEAYYLWRSGGATRLLPHL